MIGTDISFSKKGKLNMESIYREKIVLIGKEDILYKLRCSTFVRYFVLPK